MGGRQAVGESPSTANGLDGRLMEFGRSILNVTRVGINDAN